MDWNWFLSALAQSGAAFIGIIGAFLTSRILSEKNVFGDIHERFRDTDFQRTNTVQNLKNCRFEWYNKNTILESEQFWNRLNQLQGESTADPESIAENCLIEVNGLYESLGNLTFVISLINRQDDEYGVYRNCVSPPGDVSFMELEKERLKIENLRHKCNILMRKYGLIKNDINKAISRFKTIYEIVALLLVGSLVTVCIPITLLPVDISAASMYEAISFNSIGLRVCFAGSLFLMIAVLCIMLVYSLYEIKKNYLMILEKITEKHLTLRGYSSYFSSDIESDKSASQLDKVKSRFGKLLTLLRVKKD